MVPTSKCLDVGDHICAVVYTTSYVRQFLVGAVYYTARTYIGHDDRSSAQLWRSLSYIRGGITEIGYFASWVYCSTVTGNAPGLHYIESFFVLQYFSILLH